MQKKYTTKQKNSNDFLLSPLGPSNIYVYVTHFHQIALQTNVLDEEPKTVTHNVQQQQAKAHLVLL